MQRMVVGQVLDLDHLRRWLSGLWSCVFWEGLYLWAGFPVGCRAVERRSRKSSKRVRWCRLLPVEMLLVSRSAFGSNRGAYTNEQDPKWQIAFAGRGREIVHVVLCSEK